MNKNNLSLINKYLSLLLILPFTYFGYSQEKLLYKQIDSTELYMRIFYPSSIGVKKINYPAILFFHGGGWINGSLYQLKPHAEYFSQRGVVSILVEYRVKNKHKTSPFESLKDAKSAVRFVKKNAVKLRIDTTKIVTAGASSGGHLAAATALIDGYNEYTDDMSIDASPDALILFNPVVDNGPGGYGYNRIDEEYKDFSPIHNLKQGAPPTILFLGTDDVLIPVETLKYYQKVMEKVGSRCELFLYEGQAHGFFNHRNFEYYKKTVSKADKFLQSINFLSNKMTIEIKK